MRDGWQQTTLGEVATQYVDGFSVLPNETYTNLGVQWYAGGTFAREPKLGSEMKATRLFRVKPGQFIYNRMFVTEGSFALVAAEHADGVVSNEFPVFDLDEAQVLPAYLVAYFQQPQVWRGVADEATGTTKSRRRWKEPQFLAHSISLPPVDEQCRIVDLIAAVDGAVEAAESEATVAAVARRSLWSAVATHHVCVGEIGDVSQGRSLPKDLQGIDSGEVSWFKIADMTSPGNLYGYTAAESRVTSATLAERGGRITTAGSVAFPRVGAAVATEKKRLLEVDAALDENHIAVTPRAGGQSEVLLAAFESIRLGDLVRKGAVPSLNMGLIRSLEISRPADGERRPAIDGLLSAARLSERSARETAEALRALRTNLLTVLLSGEHEIPASYDVLLEGETA